MDTPGKISSFWIKIPLTVILAFFLSPVSCIGTNVPWVISNGIGGIGAQIGYAYSVQKIDVGLSKGITVESDLERRIGRLAIHLRPSLGFSLFAIGEILQGSVSCSDTSWHSGARYGWKAGTGFNWVIFGDFIFLPTINISSQFTFSTIPFSELIMNSANHRIDQNLDIFDASLCFWVAKQVSRFVAPFGGINFGQTWDWWNEAGSETTKARRASISPFAGLSIGDYTKRPSTHLLLQFSPRDSTSFYAGLLFSS